jgi:hypothetical protein
MANRLENVVGEGEIATKSTAEYEKLQSSLERMVNRLENIVGDDETATKSLLSKLEDAITNSVATRAERQPNPHMERKHTSKGVVQVHDLEVMLLELLDRQRKHDHNGAMWKAEKLMAEAKALKASEESKAARRRELDMARKAKKAGDNTKEVDQQHLSESKAAEYWRMAEEEMKEQLASCKKMHSAVSNQFEQLIELQGYNCGQMPVGGLHTTQGTHKPGLPDFSDAPADSIPFKSSLKHSLQHSTSICDVTKPAADYLPTTKGIYHTSLHRKADCVKVLAAPGRANTNHTEEGPNLVVFPSLVPTSVKTIQLQSHLSMRGLLAKHDELGATVGETSPIDTGDFARPLVQSTIFWEPPTVTLGSGLMRTLRLRGWKPFYFRMSGKYSAA